MPTSLDRVVGTLRHTGASIPASAPAPARPASAAPNSLRWGARSPWPGPVAARPATRPHVARPARAGCPRTPGPGAGSGGTPGSGRARPGPAAAISLEPPPPSSVQQHRRVPRARPAAPTPHPRLSRPWPEARAPPDARAFQRVARSCPAGKARAQVRGHPQTARAVAGQGLAPRTLALVEDGGTGAAARGAGGLSVEGGYGRGVAGAWGGAGAGGVCGVACARASVVALQECR